MFRIERMEREMAQKQHTLETLRKEKVDLEQTLEQEQEALVNRLWKRMDKLEREKRSLQEKLNQPVSIPPSPPPESINEFSSGRVTPNSNISFGSRRLSRERGISGAGDHISSSREISRERNTFGRSRDAEQMAIHVRQLRKETDMLKRQLKNNQTDRK